MEGWSTLIAREHEHLRLRIGDLGVRVMWSGAPAQADLETLVATLQSAWHLDTTKATEAEIAKLKALRDCYVRQRAELDAMQPQIDAVRAKLAAIEAAEIALEAEQAAARAPAAPAVPPLAPEPPVPGVPAEAPATAPLAPQEPEAPPPAPPVPPACSPILEAADEAPAHAPPLPAPVDQPRARVTARRSPAKSHDAQPEVTGTPSGLPCDYFDTHKGQCRRGHDHGGPVQTIRCTVPGCPWTVDRCEAHRSGGRARMSLAHHLREPHPWRPGARRAPQAAPPDASTPPRAADPSVSRPTKAARIAAFTPQSAPSVPRPVGRPTSTPSRGDLARCKAPNNGEMCGHPCFADERQAHLRDTHNIDPTARALRLYFAPPVGEE